MNELEALKAELAATRERVASLEGQRRSRLKWGLLAAAGVLVAVPAWSQLHTFVASQPAVASDVNDNFSLLKANDDNLLAWLQQKVGLVGSATVTLTQPLAGTQVITTANLQNGAVGNAQPSPDFQCPDATAIASYGQCIFYLPTSGPGVGPQQMQLRLARRARRRLELVPRLRRADGRVAGLRQRQARLRQHQQLEHGRRVVLQMNAAAVAMFIAA